MNMNRLALVALLLLSACANDPQGGGALGGAIGGATGAAVGYEMGGRSGAIVGGALGGAAGAAVGHNASTQSRQQPVYQQPVYQPARGEGEYRHDRRDRQREDDNED